MSNPPLCACGCGGHPKPYKRNRPYLGHVKGEYPKFINGHNNRVHVDTQLQGYKLVYAPTHPKAFTNNYVFEHVLIAEKALGKYLPEGVEIHHVDEDRANNGNSNLVICPDSNYHRLLHKRTRALNASGHADWERCPYCKQYDDPDNMRKASNGYHHKACKNAYESNRRRTN